MAEENHALSGVLLDESIELTLIDLCCACKVDAECVIEMVEEGVIETQGASSSDWRFKAAALKRAQTALRLQRDLGINLAGAALALDLLEELEALRSKGKSGA